MAAYFIEQQQHLQGRHTVLVVVEIGQRFLEQKHNFTVGKDEGFGCLQTERRILYIVAQIVANIHQRSVVACQHQDVAILVVQVVDLMSDGRQYLLIELFGGYKADAHPSSRFDGLLHQLHPAGLVAQVDLLQLRVVGEMVAHRPFEKAVVELHHVAPRAIVAHEVLHDGVGDGHRVLFVELHLWQANKLAHIALPKTVDSLLGVAHHQRDVALAGGAAMRHSLINQGIEIVELHAARVLKLVDEVTKIATADTFVDERGRLVGNHVGDAFVELRDMDTLVFSIIVTLDNTYSVE